MTFNYLRRIYLSDTDAAGVVYFAKGLEICHQAYEESLAETGINLNQTIQEGNIALPIVRAKIDFSRPIFLADRIRVSLVASLVSNNEFAIAYQISPFDNLEQILVRAQTKHVCIDPQTRKKISLPSTMLEWVNRFQSKKIQS